HHQQRCQRRQRHLQQLTAVHALPVPRRRGSRRASAATLFRIALAVLLVTSLAGCGVTMQTGIDMVRSAVGGSDDDLEAVAAQAAASPYASLMVDDGRVRGVMVLGNDDEGRLSWHSGSQLLFLCEGGLVCGTHGLG